MANIEFLNHGNHLDDNSRYVYCSPINITNGTNGANGTIYYNDGSVGGGVAIIETSVGDSVTRKYITDGAKTISNIRVIAGDVRTVVVNCNDTSNISIGDVVYISIGLINGDSDDVKPSKYALNSSCFIVGEITTNATITLNLHYIISDEVANKYSKLITTESAINGDLIKPIYNIDTDKLFKVSFADIVDGCVNFEFNLFNSSDTNTDTELLYKNIIVYSSDLVGVSTDITEAGVIYNLTDSGYVFNNDLSVQNNIVRYGSTTPAILITLDGDGHNLNANNRIKIGGTITSIEPTSGSSNQGIYNYYDANIVRMVESISAKYIGDMWDSIVGIDIIRGVTNNDGVDYGRLESYIDSILRDQNATNTFDDIYVINNINLGATVSMFSKGNSINFKTQDGTFGISVNSESLGYDRIIYDNNAIVQFNDNVECNNKFEVRYSASTINDSNRTNTIIDAMSGFLKIKLDNNTSADIIGDKINYFFTVMSNEEVDSQILFSSYMWQKDDISTLGYYSHRNINNLSTFNNFMSGKMTSIVNSQSLNRIGLISQGDMYLHAVDNINALSDNVTIEAKKEMVITANKLTFNTDNLGFNLNILDVNTLVTNALRVGNIVANDISATKVFSKMIQGKELILEYNVTQDDIDSGVHKGKEDGDIVKYSIKVDGSSNTPRLTIEEIERG